MKRCTRCGVEYVSSAEFFNRKKSNKDGLYCHCKSCSSISNKKKYEDNREIIIKATSQYKKDNKEKIKEQSKAYNKKHEFRIKEYRSGRRQHYLGLKKSWDKKNIDRVRQYRELNREKINVYGQLRSARIKELPHNFTLKQWEIVKLYFSNKCAYCNGKKPLEQDHFVPVSKGGEYTKENIIPTCRSCNASKSDRFFFEWYSNHESYSKQRERKILQFLNYNKNKEQQLALL